MYVLRKVVLAFVLLCAGFKYTAYKWRESKRKGSRKTIGFFHPYCDAGGGGERVLWVFIDALLNKPEFHDRLHIVLYSGENRSAEEIFANVEVSTCDIVCGALSVGVLMGCVNVLMVVEKVWHHLHP